MMPSGYRSEFHYDLVMSGYLFGLLFYKYTLKNNGSLLTLMVLYIAQKILYSGIVFVDY